ncbi:E4-ORF6/7 [Bat mastadenovirus]|uniref:E4-ORF6/7 n=1 Tax=Bat mastadenovirus TaxID=740971 RepID=A0A3G9ED72_9ADEN|nr:E4-ORF6/7 [Bat mastadenovirus]BBE29323.1 E4-ORF6/7 [Bat mastadenovirus]
MESCSSPQESSHVTTVPAFNSQDLCCAAYLHEVDAKFLELTDPAFKTTEFVSVGPAPTSQKELYVNACCERVVYKVAFAEGGGIITRVF